MLTWVCCCQSWLWPAMSNWLIIIFENLDAMVREHYLWSYYTFSWMFRCNNVKEFSQINDPASTTLQYRQTATTQQLRIMVYIHSDWLKTTHTWLFIRGHNDINAWPILKGAGAPFSEKHWDFITHITFYTVSAIHCPWTRSSRKAASLASWGSW